MKKNLPSVALLALSLSVAACGGGGDAGGMSEEDTNGAAGPATSTGSGMNSPVSGDTVPAAVPPTGAAAGGSMGPDSIPAPPP